MMSVINKLFVAFMPKEYRLILMLLLVASMAACSVGPDYVRPTAVVPKEFKELKGWKEATPRDHEIKTAWWKAFNDPVLNSLVDKVNVSNQSLAQAEAQYRQALAMVQGARAAYFPRVTTSASATRSRPANVSTSSGTDTATQYSVSGGISWEIDLWGKVRRQVESSTATAQASAADLQALRLSIQTEVAQNYFQLRIIDVQKRILDDTVAAYRKSLELTQNRYKAGVAAKADVIQAQTQLKSTEAQAIDTGVQRAQLEHAIAILMGQAPADFALPATAEVPDIPQIPVGIPSDLLERRPDIASAERKVAAANAQIGVARAAYYPSLTLSASAGYQNPVIGDLFTVPSFFWSLGPALLAQTIFDGGARAAQTDQAIASYDATVAAYRQTVLTGFQQVEDNLAALRILAEEAAVQNEAVNYAIESVKLTTNQYKAGTVSFLNVIVAQAIALNNEKTAVGIRGQRLTAAVLLIKALGGGWHAAELTGKKPEGAGKTSEEVKK